MLLVIRQLNFIQNVFESVLLLICSPVLLLYYFPVRSLVSVKKKSYVLHGDIRDELFGSLEEMNFQGYRKHQTNVFESL